VVTLKNGAEGEDVVATLNGATLLDFPVEVKLNPCSRLLCVAELPPDMDEGDFHALIHSYGETERCFLMRNAQGESFIMLVRF
jgi:hypothetical protein